MVSFVRNTSLKVFISAPKFFLHLHIDAAVIAMRFYVGDTDKVILGKHSNTLLCFPFMNSSSGTKYGILLLNRYLVASVALQTGTDSLKLSDR